MKQRIFNRSMLIALVGLFLALTNVALAQERQSHTLSMTGLAPGQTLRLNVTNNQPRTKPSVSARIVARNAKGIVVGQTDETTVPAGDSRPFNFNLDELNSAGEPGVSLQFELQFMLQELNLTETSRALQLSADLVEQSTGKVVTLVVRSSLERRGQACWSFCTSLLCVNVCLSPFTSFVTTNPPGGW